MTFESKMGLPEVIVITKKTVSYMMTFKSKMGLKVIVITKNNCLSL